MQLDDNYKREGYDQIIDGIKEKYEKIIIEDEYDESNEIRKICEFDVLTRDSKDIYKRLELGGFLTTKTEEAISYFDYDHLRIVHGDWKRLPIPAEQRLKIKDLYIGSDEIDWEVIAGLSNVEKMNIGGWFTMPLSFSGFSKLKILDTYWNKGYLDFYKLPSLETLKLTGWKGEFSDFGSLKSLKHLRLVNSRTITSLDGIEKCKNLEYLEIYSSPKLIDCSALAKCKNLKYLRFELCNRLENFDFLKNLKLKELGLFGKLNIPNMDIILELKTLRLLAIGGGAKVVDGNLTKINSLPDLRVLRMQNYRHYIPKVSDIEISLKRHLKGSKTEEYNQFQYEGLYV